MGHTPGLLNCFNRSNKLLHAKHFLDIALVVLVHQGVMSQRELTLLRFFGQNMTLVSVLPFDLSRTGKLESLFGTGFRFLFRHLSYVFVLFRFAFINGSVS